MELNSISPEVNVDEHQDTITIRDSSVEAVTTVVERIELKEPDSLRVIDAAASGYNKEKDTTVDNTVIAGITHLRGFSYVYLNWVQSFVAPNHKHVEILRSETNDVNSANVVGSSTTATFSDSVAPDKTYYYWLRARGYAQNTAGNYSDVVTVLPSGDQATITAFLGLDDVDSRLNSLSTDITALRTELIALIDLTETNVNSGVNSLITDQITTVTDTLLEAINTTQIANASARASLQEQITILNTGAEAQVTVSNTLTAQINAETGIRVAEIQRIDNAASTLSSSLASTTETLNALVQNGDAVSLAEIENYKLVVAGLLDAQAQSILSLQAQFNTDIANANAAITTEQLARSDAISALASQFTTLSAEFDQAELDLNARITSEETARSSAVQAVAQQVTTLEADVTSDINSLSSQVTIQQQTVADSFAAYASQIALISAEYSGLQGQVNTAVAAVNAESTTRASEDAALAQNILDLTAEVGDVEARAQAYTLAQVGYCVIGGDISDHTNKAACETAGGTWQVLPLSQAINMVSVSYVDANGDTVSGSVGTNFQAIVDDYGTLRTRAFFGTDVNGRVTGIVATGSDGTESSSEIDIIGDKINLLNPNTLAPFLSFDTVNGRAVFRGQLILEDGTVVSNVNDLGQGTTSGEDGDTIYWEYQYSVNGTTAWHSPMATGDIYRRERKVVNGSPEAWSGAARIAGSDGANGPQGAPGLPKYTWIKYSPNADGSAMTDIVQSDTLYIGIAYNRDSATESTNPLDYEWGRFVGTDGLNGEDGFDGEDGKSGNFTSFVFRNELPGITPSAPTGGTFNGTSETIPGGFTDDPVYENGKITWVSKRIYSENPDKSWSGTAWSTPAKFFEQGVTGKTGPGLYVIVNADGVFPSDSVATAAFTSTFGFAPKEHDHLTYVNGDNTNSSVKRFNGSSWVAPLLVVNGDILTNGTITADKINVADLFARNINLTHSIVVQQNGTVLKLSAEAGQEGITASYNDVPYFLMSPSRQLVNGLGLLPGSVQGDALSADALARIRDSIGASEPATGGFKEDKFTFKYQQVSTRSTISAFPHGGNSIRVKLVGNAVWSSATDSTSSCTLTIQRKPSGASTWDFVGDVVVNIESTVEPETNIYTNIVGFDNSFTPASTSGNFDYRVTLVSAPAFFSREVNCTFSVFEEGSGGSAGSTGSELLSSNNVWTGDNQFDDLVKFDDQFRFGSKTVDTNDYVQWDVRNVNGRAEVHKFGVLNGSTDAYRENWWNGGSYNLLRAESGRFYTPQGLATGGQVYVEAGGIIAKRNGVTWHSFEVGSATTATYRCDADEWRLWMPNSNTQIRAFNGGQVELNYDGALRVKTRVDGVEVNIKTITPAVELSNTGFKIDSSFTDNMEVTSANINACGVRVRTSDSAVRGSLHGNSSNAIGILDYLNRWAVRYTDTGHERYVNGVLRERVTPSVHEVMNAKLRIQTDYKYVDIGALNDSWMHFNTDANVGFWFGKAVHVNGRIGVYNTNVYMTSAGVFDQNERVFSPVHLPTWDEVANRPDVFEVAAGTYPGLAPNGVATGWVRSPTSGLLPYQSGGASSSLGSSTWAWKDVWGTTIRAKSTLLVDGTTNFINTVGVYDNNSRVFSPVHLPQWEEVDNKPTLFHSVVNSSGHPGLAPNGNTSGWTRTTSSGLIPFASGGASSSLGTETWAFNYAHVRYMHAQQEVRIRGTDNYMDSTGVYANKVRDRSDERVKCNFEPITGALPKVLQLNGWLHNWRHDPNESRKHAAVKAQEMQRVFPEAVYEDNRGLLSVCAAGEVALLIEAIKDLHGIVQDQAHEIALLKRKVGV